MITLTTVAMPLVPISLCRPDGSKLLKWKWVPID